MPSMLSDQLLLSDVGGDPIMVASKDQQVVILQSKQGFTQVRLVNVPGKPEGWVPSDAVAQGPSPVVPIDKTAFARACVRQSVMFGIHSHYLVAVAQLRTGISPDTSNGAVGPFGLTQAEWDDCRTNPALEVDFAASDIGDWTSQCVVFAAQARVTEDALIGLFGHAENSVELYLAQLVGAGAAVAMSKMPALDVRAALGAVLAADLPPGGASPQQIVDRYGTLLAPGGAPGTFKPIGARINDAFAKAFADTTALMLHVGLAPLQDPVAVAPPTAGVDPKINLQSRRIPPGRVDMAKLIINLFAGAGYGVLQQIAAVANAIGESSLNPTAHTTSGEDSVGLFQLNRQGGEGTGFSVEQLSDPTFNTNRILLKANRFTAFRNAASLHAAVDVFVRDVEQPRNPAADIAKRFAIAQELLA